MTKTKLHPLAEIEDIQRLAKQIKDNWSLCELFDDTPRALEAEMMVAQTIHACVINHQKLGEAFSFRERRVYSRGCGGLENNASAYRMLLNRGYFVKNQRRGKPVIFVTKKLINLLDHHFG